MAKDTSFYSIVVLIAVIILMLTLIWLGIEISKKKEDADFPPSRPVCPDYWKQMGNECEIPVTRHPNNKGIMNETGDGLLINSGNTPGMDDALNTIDMEDSGWKANGSDICAKRSWANEYGVVWDGVSNFNKC
tara:strand:+ start:912 stop:1310 length:399 start_codon:yes stop_codon:yes gene_type:complete